MNKEKRNWCLMAIFLYLPFFIEFFAYPLFQKIQPEWLGIALFMIIYTYLFYGAAIVVYHKWSKRTDEPVTWKLKHPKAKTVIIALLVGIVFRRLEFFMFGESQTPMLITEFIGYTKNAPVLWMGIIGYLLQEIYYIFEFTLAACIVDCAQKAFEKFGWSRRIPWGGLFLGLTWGLGHIITKNDVATGVWCLLLSLVIGSVYTYLKRTPTTAWLTIAAAYLL